MTNSNFTREVWSGIAGGAQPGSGAPGLLSRLRRLLARLVGRRRG